ncbi:HAD family phosphatase [Rhizobium sp. 18055]|uniref:HAD family hydrolase n=1 Tax=Rhizobium sp. 18055 TaxID=2681403 RepID=UPI00135CA3B4|nr:HAD family hydrolase [Rhizobium sp. 18055]
MVVFIRALLVVLCIPMLAGAQDLPSWNAGTSRQAIIDFVQKTTSEAGPAYIKPEERIAVFDNDGTLWPEQPYYVQLAFALDRVKLLAPQHPEWKAKEPFKSVLAGDLGAVAKSGPRGVAELVVATHAGMTTTEFETIVSEWFSTAKHPKTGKRFLDMTYLPMRELLDYLRANGFKTYIVSGGGVEFMRPIAQATYGIPPEQVIGSTIETKFAIVDDVPVLRRLPKIDFVNDGPGKPVGINKFIGRRPVFVAGNSDGDYEMLRWTTEGPQHGFAMIVHHTDSVREYQYDRTSAFGKLDKALNEAELRNWLVVDMKADWKNIWSSGN